MDVWTEDGNNATACVNITTTNTSTTLDCVNDDTLVVHGIVMCLILVAVVMGNGTLLALVASNRKLHTTTVLASLGVVIADLLVTITWVFQSLSSVIAGRWIFGNVSCSFFAYLFTTLLLVRWCEVLAFTVDRTIHIIYPFFYNRNAKLLLIVFTIVAWALPAAVNLPTQVLGYSSYDKTLTACTVDCGPNSSCRSGVIALFGIFVTIGGLFPSVLYLIIFLYGRKKKWEMDRMLQMGSLSGKRIAETVETKSTWISISPQAKKALVSCFIVFLITLFTNIPVYITNILRSQTEIYDKIPIWLHFIVIYIFLTGPILDPIIVMRNKDFWEVIYKIHRRRKAHLFRARPTKVLAMSILSSDFFQTSRVSENTLTTSPSYVLRTDTKSSECESV